MFHVALVLLPLIFVAIVGSILLFGITSILVGILGGAAAVAMIKNRTIKRILFIGFCILLSIGSFCVFPFFGLYAKFSAGMISAGSAAILAFVGVLSAVGIKVSSSISGKTGKKILMISFGVVAGLATAGMMFILALAV